MSPSLIAPKGEKTSCRLWNTGVFIRNDAVTILRGELGSPAGWKLKAAIDKGLLPAEYDSVDGLFAMLHGIAVFEESGEWRFAGRLSPLKGTDFRALPKTTPVPVGTRVRSNSGLIGSIAASAVTGDVQFEVKPASRADQESRVFVRDDLWFCLPRFEAMTPAPAGHPGKISTELKSATPSEKVHGGVPATPSSGVANSTEALRPTPREEGEIGVPKPSETPSTTPCAQQSTTEQSSSEASPPAAVAAPETSSVTPLPITSSPKAAPNNGVLVTNRSNVRCKMIYGVALHSFLASNTLPARTRVTLMDRSSGLTANVILLSDNGPHSEPSTRFRTETPTRPFTSKDVHRAYVVYFSDDVRVERLVKDMVRTPPIPYLQDEEMYAAERKVDKPLAQILRSPRFKPLTMSAPAQTVAPANIHKNESPVNPAPVNGSSEAVIPSPRNSLQSYLSAIAFAEIQKSGSVELKKDLVITATIQIVCATDGGKPEFGPDGTMRLSTIVVRPKAINHLDGAGQFDL